MMELENLPQPILTEINGELFPPFLTKERVDQIPRSSLRDSDIFVATYPRCGTTWTQEVVWQILHNGELSKIILSQRFPWYEPGPWLPETNFFPPQSQVQAIMDALPSPRLIKTHLPFHLMPAGISSGPVQCKCIYVMRNPKDAAVSNYHHMYALVPIKYNGTWEQFLPLFMAGKAFFGSWYDHNLGWWSHRDDPNILFVKYEDMKKNLSSNVRKIADFLEKPLTTEIVERIAQQCTFDSMKANPAASLVETGLIRKANAAKYMRKGEVGDWKNYFTDEQNGKFDKQYAEKMEGSGLEFDWE